MVTVVLKKKDSLFVVFRGKGRRGLDHKQINKKKRKKEKSIVTRKETKKE